MGKQLGPLGLEEGSTRANATAKEDTLNQRCQRAVAVSTSTPAVAEVQHGAATGRPDLGDDRPAGGLVDLPDDNAGALPG